MKQDVTLIPILPRGHSLAEAQTLKDVAKFSSELGFRSVYLNLPSYYGFGIFIRSVPNLFLSSPLHGRNLLIPYPGPLRYADLKLLRFKSKILQKFQVFYLNLILNTMNKFDNIILYVYDLPIEQNASVLKREYISELCYQAEEVLFRRADKLLVFNGEMEKAIRKRYNTPKEKFVHFEILDMGVNFQPSLLHSLHYPQRIVYVGNLAKERVNGLEYVATSIPPNLELFTVGPNGERTRSFANYIGVLGDYAFYRILSKRFDLGLMWYSPSASFYLRFSSSSKFSSYLIAGLPVLVDKHVKWPSKLVEKYNVGITADTPKKLFHKAASISENEYLTLRENVMSLGEKLRRGYFIKRAIKKAMVE